LHVLDRGAQTDACGAAEVLDHVSQADARGGAQVLDRGSQAAARSAACCASQVLIVAPGCCPRRRSLCD
jgi:hypothetical protein